MPLGDWKKQYGEVFSVEIRKVEYFFRALTYDEYRLASDPDFDAAEQEDFIVAQAILAPEVDFDRLPAGIVTVLAQQVIKFSGYGDPKTAKLVLENKRAEAAGVQGLMKAFVLATMPSYTEEHLDGLSYAQLAAKVALAEKIIEVQQAAIPLADGQIPQVTLTLVDPEEEAAKEAARQEKERKKIEEQLARSGGKHTNADAPPPIKQKIDPNDPIARKLREAMGG